MADNLVIRQGITWRVAFPIVGDFDHTGWTVRSQVRRDVNVPEVLYEWSSAAGNAGFEMVPAEQLTAAGHPTTTPKLCVVLRVPPTVSSSWAWRAGKYDIEATDGNDVLLVAEGRIEVIPEVTR